MRRAEIETLISSLDLVTTKDPTARCRSACERLAAELEKGVSLRRILLPAAPVGALGAFLFLEVRTLDQRGWIVLAVAAVGTLAYVIAPVDIFRTIGGFLALLCIVALSNFAHVPAYWLLAIGIGLAAHFVAAQIHPALHFEHRIRAILHYFGYARTDLNEIAPP